MHISPPPQEQYISLAEIDSNFEHWNASLGKQEHGNGWNGTEIILILYVFKPWFGTSQSASCTVPWGPWDFQWHVDKQTLHLLHATFLMTIGICLYVLEKLYFSTCYFHSFCWFRMPNLSIYFIQRSWWSMVLANVILGLQNQIKIIWFAS